MESQRKAVEGQIYRKVEERALESQGRPTKGCGRSRKVKEGQGRARKGKEGQGRARKGGGRGARKGKEGRRWKGKEGRPKAFGAHRVQRDGSDRLAVGELLGPPPHQRDGQPCLIDLHAISLVGAGSGPGLHLLRVGRVQRGDDHQPLVRAAPDELSVRVEAHLQMATIRGNQGHCVGG